MNRSARAAAAALFLAAAAGNVRAGNFVSGAYIESYSHEDRVDFGGARYVQPRQVALVPDGYGRLLHMDTEGGATVFWFQAEDGSIRNIVLATDAPVILKRGGKLEK
ncbi:MAG: hypothetical protein ACT4O3_04030 [Elusimicrobiota bacterium]